MIGAPAAPAWARSHGGGEIVSPRRDAAEPVDTPRGAIRANPWRPAEPHSFFADCREFARRILNPRHCACRCNNVATPDDQRRRAETPERTLADRILAERMLRALKSGFDLRRGEGPRGRGAGPGLAGAKPLAPHGRPARPDVRQRRHGADDVLPGELRRGGRGATA